MRDYQKPMTVLEREAELEFDRLERLQTKLNAKVHLLEDMWGALNDLSPLGEAVSDRLAEMAADYNERSRHIDYVLTTLA
jgi:hypothetical protein